ncbi:nucleoside-diphosphate kinase [Candidatus Micrarchaeota archaeon]|nr:nucleoside-diphosphate kinase [Candidatus Micrarchaeota archaeon]
MERTLVILKPDALHRGVIGAVIQRFEQKGLKIVGLKMEKLDEKTLSEHYGHLKDKPFFPRIVSFMKSAPVVLVAIEGLEAVGIVRKMCGVTNARNAAIGTIRGDFGMSVQANIVHASDSLETAQKEVKRFFKNSELFEYKKMDFGHVYAEDEQTK